MNREALIIATGVGLVLQLGMVVAGHYATSVQDMFPLGGMGFSLVAGILFAWIAKAGWSSDIVGGAVAGGVCALLGIGVSLALGDVPATVLAFGTLASAVTGAAGGAIGKVIRR